MGSSSDEIRKHRSHQFQPGYDPRRVDKAQHRNAARFREMMRTKSGAAFEFIVGVMEDDEAPLKQRVDCAQYIIDQAHGKAPGFLALEATGKQGDVSKMGLDELEQAIGSYLSGAAKQVHGEVIESEPQRAGDIMDGLSFCDAPVPVDGDQ